MSACEVCSINPGSDFITVKQLDERHTGGVHTAKAHVCKVCLELFHRQSERDGITIEEINQREYNELPVNNP